MNNRLKTIIDLKKYPIQDLNSPLMEELIKKCKSDLDQFSCATIPNFILPKSLKIMNTELEKQLDEVYMSKQSINAYLYSEDDASLPKDHPKRILWIVIMDIKFRCFCKRFGDEISYEQDELLKFVSACLGNITNLSMADL